jgi:hypothetical protein
MRKGVAVWLLAAEIVMDWWNVVLATDFLVAEKLYRWPCLSVHLSARSSGRLSLHLSQIIVTNFWTRLCNSWSIRTCYTLLKFKMLWNYYLNYTNCLYKCTFEPFIRCFQWQPAHNFGYIKLSICRNFRFNRHVAAEGLKCSHVCNQQTNSSAHI